MAYWLAAGDETGNWDMEKGRFMGGYLGVAWVLGSMSAWETALQMDRGGRSALDIFSSSFQERVKDVHWPVKSTKYHVFDVWRYCGTHDLNEPFTLDQPQSDAVLECLRQDVVWLLKDSGLGVLATGGTPQEAKVASLGLSGDGMRERAKAFAALMTVVLPFLPGADRMNFVVEGRLERDHQSEPFRDFLSRLKEDLGRSAMQCRSVLPDEKCIDTFDASGGSGMRAFLVNPDRRSAFLNRNAERVVKAMQGLADLAAALAPRPDASGVRLGMPDEMAGNLWSGNIKELSHVFKN
jgi:hypothetical protein